MKKTVLFFLVVFSLVVSVSCTDNTLEEIKQNELQKRNRLVDPSDNGVLDTEDDDES
ncbi:hypothetical protein [Tenacibaculum sp. 190524A02b]|uniref:Lipoprotein n=1 Tax=Tenacibaculum vairaonense TaxID=3137860 RepID=A0ABP1FD90_9FLAO